MGLLGNWLQGFRVKPTKLDITCSFEDIAFDIAFKEIAIQSAINLIAKSLANSEFITYDKNEEVKKDNYYLFNIEPNQNQNGYEFWVKVISKLINENEALIIQQKNTDGNSYFYLADSFEKDDKTLKKRVFFDVVINDLPMNKRYSSEDVIHLTLNNDSIKDYIDLLLMDYTKLINKGAEDYLKQNGIKGQLDIGTMITQMFTKDDNNVDMDAMNEWIKKKFKSYFNDVNSILTLEDGMKFTERQDKGNTYIKIEEIQKGIDGAFIYVAQALNIPIGILKGDLANIKQQMNNFLTFCVDPMAELIEKEINRKYFKKEDFLKGTYLKIDTSRVEHINIFDVASSLDTLSRNSWSRNELNRLLDRPQIQDDWANEHFYTLNNEKLKGGDKSEE